MAEVAHERRLTRRQLVKATGGLAVVGAGAAAGVELLRSAGGERTLRGASAAATEPVRHFTSRPDLTPPAVTVSGHSDTPGYLLVTPSRNEGYVKYSQAGPLVLDRHGEPVWFTSVASALRATNLRRTTYLGEPVLSWWQGSLVQLGVTYYGQGEAVIVDSSYRELARVRAAAGRQMDLHEFVVSPEGTALFTCCPQLVERDLSSLGGPRHARVIESVVQEVDIRSGRLLFEWRSLDHVPPSESHEPFSDYYDYLHVNSIDITDDGNLLVSGRGTWSLYKLDRRSGMVIWRLGGKRSDFAVEESARFAWQHHAVRVDEQSITLFDNGSDGPDRDEPQSRALVLRVDARRNARLARSYVHPGSLSAAAMGSVQALPNGHVLVGWGYGPYVSEFAHDGRLLADAHLLPSGVNSYRAFRDVWHGRPLDRPAIAATRDRASGHATVYASWNGATEVRHWRVHAGPEARHLRAIGVARHDGFETQIPLGRGSGYVAVSALDRDGTTLASSAPVKV